MAEYQQNALPVVNETNMKSFIGRYVIIHGKVNSVKGTNLFLTINTELNSDIIIKNFDKNVRQNAMLKIVGKVFGDLSVEAIDTFMLADDFDLKLMNETIPIINHPEVSMMFY